MQSELGKENFSELVSRAASGDAEAFGEVYRTYFTPVYRYVFIRLKGNRAEAEDVTQDAFVKIMRNLPRFEDRGKAPLAYFFTVARTTLIDRLRKQHERVFSEAEDEGIPFDVPDGRADNAEVLERNMMVEEIAGLMESEISEGEREAISLRFFGELSTREIASLMGKSEDAVRQLQSRGLRALGKKLKHHE